MKIQNFTLKDVAGYVTERMVWQMLQTFCGQNNQASLSSRTPEEIIIEGKEFRMVESPATKEATRRAFTAPEVFHNDTQTPTDASGIWTMGALAFYMITGMNVFEGKGGETQTPETDIPRLGSAYACRELSSLIRHCLSYSPSERPAMTEIAQSAEAALSDPAVPRKRLTAKSGKGYTASLVKFWPEEMTVVLLICLFACFPAVISAQEFNIPEEMAKLVFQSEDLRSAANKDKVARELQTDRQWTVMDELRTDQNECTRTDKVGSFGLNDMMPQILLKRRGVTNAGGRMRDGRDKRYKFSMLEIKVKAGKEVSYRIEGRLGQQIFAIVPFDKTSDFQAEISCNGKVSQDSFTRESVCYIRLGESIKENDKFTLTVSNRSNENAAFVIVNYNSQKQ